MNVEIKGGPQDGFMVEGLPDTDKKLHVKWIEHTGEGPVERLTEAMEIHRPFAPLNDEAYVVWPGYAL